MVRRLRNVVLFALLTIAVLSTFFVNGIMAEEIGLEGGAEGEGNTEVMEAGEESSTVENSCRRERKRSF